MAPHISQPVCASLETDSDLKIHLARISPRGEGENLHRKHRDILRLIIVYDEDRRKCVEMTARKEDVLK